MPQFTPPWNAAAPNAQRSLGRLRLDTWGVGLRAPSRAWPGHDVLTCGRAQHQGRERCVPDPRRHGEPRPHAVRGAGERGRSFSRTLYRGWEMPGTTRRPGSADTAPAALHGGGTPAARLLRAGLRAPGAGIPLPPRVHAPLTARSSAVSETRSRSGLGVGGQCAGRRPQSRSTAHTAAGLTPLLAVPVPGPGCSPRGPR